MIATPAVMPLLVVFRKARTAPAEDQSWRPNEPVGVLLRGRMAAASLARATARG